MSLFHNLFTYSSYYNHYKNSFSHDCEAVLRQIAIIYVMKLLLQAKLANMTYGQTVLKDKTFNDIICTKRLAIQPLYNSMRFDFYFMLNIVFL